MEEADALDDLLPGTEDGQHADEAGEITIRSDSPSTARCREMPKRGSRVAATRCPDWGGWGWRGEVTTEPDGAGREHQTGAHGGRRATQRTNCLPSCSICQQSKPPMKGISKIQSKGHDISSHLGSSRAGAEPATQYWAHGSAEQQQGRDCGRRPSPWRLRVPAQLAGDGPGQQLMPLASGTAGRFIILSSGSCRAGESPAGRA